MCPVQQLESVWWMEDGENILSSHSDGSYCQWTVTGEDPQTEPVKQEIPYGETTLPESLVFSVITSVIAVHTMFNEELTSRLSKKICSIYKNWRITCLYFEYNPGVYYITLQKFRVGNIKKKFNHLFEIEILCNIIHFFTSYFNLFIQPC